MLAASVVNSTASQEVRPLAHLITAMRCWRSSRAHLRWTANVTAGGRKILRLKASRSSHFMEGFDLDQIRVAIYNYLAGGMMRWKASGTGKRIPLPIAESEEYLKALPALWPTPTSCDHKGLVPLATYRILCGEKRANGSRIGMTLCLHPLIILDKVRNGGQLNPVWLEWLMGYPAGWTSMK